MDYMEGEGRVAHLLVPSHTIRSTICGYAAPTNDAGLRTHSIQCSPASENY
eukprot:COSAG01_NODE_69603_length_261_cov_0.537037_1_plen_50_part_10